MSSFGSDRWGFSLRPIMSKLIAARVWCRAGGAMCGHVEGSQQAAFFGCEDYEENRPLGLTGCSEGMCQFDDPYCAGAVVVGSVPDFIAAAAVVIVLRGDEKWFLARALGPSLRVIQLRCRLCQYARKDCGSGW